MERVISNSNEPLEIDDGTIIAALMYGNFPIELIHDFIIQVKESGILYVISEDEFAEMCEFACKFGRMTTWSEEKVTEFQMCLSVHTNWQPVICLFGEHLAYKAVFGNLDAITNTRVAFERPRTPNSTNSNSTTAFTTITPSPIKYAVEPKTDHAYFWTSLDEVDGDFGVFGAIQKIEVRRPNSVNGHLAQCYATFMYGGMEWERRMQQVSDNLWTLEFNNGLLPISYFMANIKIRLHFISSGKTSYISKAKFTGVKYNGDSLHYLINKCARLMVDPTDYGFSPSRGD